MLNSAPWLVPDAVKFLEQLLEARTKIVIETGAGGSTIWLSKKCAHLVSFEHTKRYHDLVKRAIKDLQIDNIDLYYDREYPKKGVKRVGYNFDIALIDGRGRQKSFETIMPMMKKGGYIVLDNSERKRYAKICHFLDSKKYPKAVFFEKWQTTFWRLV